MGKITIEPSPHFLKHTAKCGPKLGTPMQGSSLAIVMLYLLYHPLLQKNILGPHLTSDQSLSNQPQNPTLTLRQTGAGLLNRFQNWVNSLTFFCNFGLQFWCPSEALKPPPSCLGAFFYKDPFLKQFQGRSEEAKMKIPYGRHSKIKV